MPELNLGAPKGIAHSINRVMNMCIADASTTYSFNLSLDKDEDCAANLEEFLRAAKRNDLKVFVTIDEYDCITRQLAHRDDADANAARSILKAITGIIKRSAGECRLFMTGVTLLAFNEISNSANFISDISMNPNLALVCGLSHDEVKGQLRLIHQHSPAVASDERFVDDLFGFLLTYCNGFRFVACEPQTVFNPQQCLHFFQYLLKQDIKRVLDNVRAVSASGKSALQDVDFELCFDTHTQASSESEIDFNLSALNFYSSTPCRCPRTHLSILPPRDDTL